MSAPVWTFTIALVVALLLFDYFFHVRKEHVPTLKEAAIWSSVYVGIAVLFGVVLWAFAGHQIGLEYFAGYLTEKALSVDNLFVFLLLFASFKVPRQDQQKVLLFGIVFSLVARTAFIFVGAALLNRFAALFYLFGLFLIVTAGRLITPGEDDDDADNIVVRLAKKVIPATDNYDGDRLFTMENGKRVMTPMLLVMVAIGGTDVMFALDSIPAIFGLTQNVFIVFTATTFSLLGLRQLYFLLDGLLDRLVFLSYGLAVILGFIGVKLILHALHENNLPFINDGEAVPVVEVPIGLSLGLIVVVLLVTVLTSLYTPRGRKLTRQNAVVRHAREFLADDDPEDAGDHAGGAASGESGRIAGDLAASGTDNAGNFTLDPAGGSVSAASGPVGGSVSRPAGGSASAASRPVGGSLSGPAGGARANASKPDDPREAHFASLVKARAALRPGEETDEIRELLDHVRFRRRFGRDPEPEEIDESGGLTTRDGLGGDVADAAVDPSDH